MSCQPYSESIAAAAAGEEMPADLEAHVGVCASCRAELAALRQALGLADAVLRDAVAQEPSPALRGRIREAVAGDSAVAGHRRLVRLWTSAAVAAVLVLAAVAGWRAPWFVRPRQMAAVERPRPAPTVGATREVPKPALAVEARHEPPVRRRAAPSRRRVDGSRRSAPEIMVPTGQQRLLLQLVAAVARSGVVPPSLLAENGSARPLPEAPPIEIAPLEIAPLETAESPGL